MKWPQTLQVCLLFLKIKAESIAKMPLAACVQGSALAVVVPALCLWRASRCAPVPSAIRAGEDLKRGAPVLVGFCSSSLPWEEGLIWRSWVERGCCGPHGSAHAAGGLSVDRTGLIGSVVHGRLSGDMEAGQA